MQKREKTDVLTDSNHKISHPVGVLFLNIFLKREFGALKIAAIDIGTNSMRLMVAETEDERIIEKEKYIFFTRMGEGLDKSKIISREVMERNFKGLEEVKAICDQKGVEAIVAYGTSALRDAVNKSDFIAEAFDRTGIKVETISGEDEAFYGYLGVISSLESRDFLIIDVGGGSTEFIQIKEGERKCLKSLDIGAVRLSEKFPLGDPPDIGMIALLEEHLDNIFDKKFEDGVSDKLLVGIGGTATTLSAIKLGLESYDPDKIGGSRLSYNEIEKIYRRLSQMTLKERLDVKGLEPKRADIILTGTAIIKRFMERYEISEIVISDNDNLEGTVYHKIKKNKIKKKY